MKKVLKIFVTFEPIMQFWCCSRFRILRIIHVPTLFSRSWQSQEVLYKHLCHPLIKSFVKISLQRRHAPMVEDGAFSHKIDFFFTIFMEDSKSERVSKLHHWFMSYGDFAEWIDLAYWWSFNGGWSVINRATQSSLYKKKRTLTVWLQSTTTTFVIDPQTHGHCNY